jgi:hypothetical protein
MSFIADTNVLYDSCRFYFESCHNRHVTVTDDAI